MKDTVLDELLEETEVMHSNGTDPLDLKELLRVLSLVKNGRLNTRMPVRQAGITGRICEVLNDIIDMNERLVAEISEAEKNIGIKGNLSRRIELADARGDWAAGVSSLIYFISDLTSPTL